MAKVFVSYSRKDIVFAKRLTAELQKCELDFWIDWEGIPPTVDWWKEIEKGIEEADVFLFLISPDSAKSKVCGQEIEVAVKNGKRIIPIVVRDIAWEDTPKHLGHLNYIFIRESDDFDGAVKKLVTAIQTDYEWAATHRRLQVKALEWERNNKENSFMLRGKDLIAAETNLALNTSKEPHPTDLQREYALESRKAAERQRKITTWISIAAAIALAGLAFFGLYQARVAKEREKIARAGELAAHSIGLRDNDFQLSLLLGIEAYRELVTVQSEGALFANAQIYPQLRSFLSGNTDKVSAVAFSPDGKTLASGNANGDSFLWDLSAGKPYELQPPNQTYPVAGVAFSPDGETFASTLFDGSVLLWDISSGTYWEFYGTASTTMITFSSDGKTMVAGGADGFALLDVSTGTLRAQVSAQPAFSITSIVCSPDGNTIVYGNAEGNLMLWDVSTQTSLPEQFTGQEHIASSLAFSPDGKTLASGRSDGVISLWNINSSGTLSQFATLTGHRDVVSSIAFSRDGKTMASGSADKTIILWDLSTNQQKYLPLIGHAQRVNSVAFSPDGKTLASGSDDGNIILWDVETRQLISRSLSGLSESVHSAAFSSDNRTLATKGEMDRVEYWDASTATRLMDLPSQADFSTKSAASNPDWTTIAPDEILSLSELYSVSNAFSADGQELALGSCGKLNAYGECTEGMIVLMNVSRGTQLGPKLTGHTTLITSLAFSPDSRIFASGDASGTIVLWDLETRQPIGLPLIRHAGWVNYMAFSPDGNTLVSVGSDNTVTLSELNPESWIEQSCQRAGRNFTQTEWEKYFPQEPYPTKKELVTCPNWRLEPQVTQSILLTR